MGDAGAIAVAIAGRGACCAGCPGRGTGAQGCRAVRDVPVRGVSKYSAAPTTAVTRRARTPRVWLQAVRKAFPACHHILSFKLCSRHMSPQTLECRVSEWVWMHSVPLGAIVVLAGNEDADRGRDGTRHATGNHGKPAPKREVPPCRSLRTPRLPVAPVLDEPYSRGRVGRGAARCRVWMLRHKTLRRRCSPAEDDPGTAHSFGLWRL